MFCLMMLLIIFYIIYFTCNIKGHIPDQWKVWTWKEYWDDCYSFAKSMCFMEISPFKIINIIGFNSVSIIYIYI